MQAYVPGTGVLFAADNVLLFLPDPVDAESAQELWKSASTTRSSRFLGILECLTTRTSNPVVNIPEFALLEVMTASDGACDIRVAVSGAVDVCLRPSGASSPRHLDGVGAAIWREEKFASVCQVVLRAAHVSPGDTQASCRFPNSFDVFGVFPAHLPSGVSLTQSEETRVLLPLQCGVVAADYAVWEAAPVESVEVASASEYLDSEAAFEEDFGRTLTDLPEDWSMATTLDPEPETSYGEEDVRDAEDHREKHRRDEGDEFGGEVPVLAHPDAIATEVLAPRSRGVAPTAAYVVPNGVIRFSHGEVVELGAPIVVGRKPTHEGAGVDPSARLVAVPSPSKDISRNHLLIRVDHGDVVATDLNSVNGTVLKRLGEMDYDLSPSEPIYVRVGDQLDLGDGVTLTFERVG